MDKEFKLSRVQFNNLHAAQDDLNAIDAEIARAKKGEIPIDQNLLDNCQDCRDRINYILDNYQVIDERGINKRGKPISRGTRKQL